MGSYYRFPKASPAAEAARQRDQEWREGEFRRAMRLPRPQEKLGARIGASDAIRLSIDHLDIAEPQPATPQPTRH